MKVKDIMVAAAKLLGIEQEIASYCNGESLECESAVTLLDCVYEVENEVALDYMPLVAKEQKRSDDGQYGYSAFDNQVARILCVTDEWGNSAPFTLYACYMTTQPGKVVITYTYSPKKKGMEEECEVAVGASERLLTYGVAAAYALLKGLYEEASVWDKKYKDAIAAAMRQAHAKRIKGRTWV